MARVEALVAPGARGRWILYSSSPHPPAEVLKEFGRMGFPFHLLREVDDRPPRVLRCFARAQVRLGLRSGLGVRGSPLSPPCQLRVLGEVADWPPVHRIDQRAKREYTSPRNYRRAFRDQGLPCPRRLRSCGRVLELTVLVLAGLVHKPSLASALGLAGADSVEKLYGRCTGRKLSVLLRREEPMDPFAWFLDEELGIGVGRV
jgi:hypothetical protein